MLSFDDQEEAEPIRAFNPHIVGLSAVTAEAGNAQRIAKLTKQLFPDTVVVLGGPHATVFEHALQETAFDFVVRNEGEKTLASLIDLLAEEGDFTELTGISYRDDRGEIVHNPPAGPLALDEVPFPDWDQIDLDFYSNVDNYIGLVAPGLKKMSMSTSRGCPYQCIFCHNIFGKKIRTRSAESVLAEMRALKERGVGEIMVVDDIFNMDHDRMMAILDGMIEEKLDLRLSFPNGVRGDIFTREELEKLREAGTYFMAFAIESGSPRVQKLINKRLNLEKVLQNAKIASDLDIITCCFFMIGFPSETREEMLETLKIAARPEIDLPNIFVTIPQYGTRLYDLAVETGFIDGSYDFDAYQYARSPMNCSNVDDEAFKKIRAMAEEVTTAHLHAPRFLEKMAHWGLSFPAHKGNDQKGRPMMPRLDRLEQSLQDIPQPETDRNLRVLHEKLKRFAERSQGKLPWLIEGIEEHDNRLNFSASENKTTVGAMVTPRDDDDPRFAATANFNIVIKGDGGRSGLSGPEIKLAKTVIGLLERLER